MKELTIEEKAKAYNKVREKIAIRFGSNVADEIFSEYEDNKDEKIRKALIRFHRSTIDIDGIKGEDIIAWLEKQDEQKPVIFRAKDWYVSKVDGKIHNMMYNPADKKEQKEIDNYCREHCKGFQETGKCFFDDKCEAYKTYKQKSADKVEHKFHEGEWIVQKDLGTYKIIEVCESWYEVISYNDGIRYSIGFNKENDCHLWTIQDAKDGDVLVTVDNESPFIYKGCLDPNHPDSPVAYCGIDCEGYFCKGGDKFDHWWTESKVQPATKEQCDLLFQKMKESGYECDADRKELRKIENEIEIPFGAKDSELQEVTYYIPQGFHAEIDDNKVVIKKGEKPTAWSEEDEKILNDIDVTLFEEKSTPNVKYWKFMNWLKSIKERLSS